MSNKFKYIDLFSGCGGLSLGLEAAGFELVLAVEKSNMAAETFYHNFIKRIESEKEWVDYCDLPIEEQAKTKLVVSELQSVLNSAKLIENLKNEGVDLIAGGPPCQGFSLAGRRNPDDARNELPWQFIELVEKISPKMVLIENVSGIRQDFKKAEKSSPFDQLKQALELTNEGYVVQSLLVNAMHFGAPQHRPRVMLVGLRSDIATRLGIRASDNIWSSYYDDPEGPDHMHPPLAPYGTHYHDKILTVADAIGDLDSSGYRWELFEDYYLSSEGEYSKYMRNDISWMPNKIRQKNRTGEIANHVLRRHSDRIALRFSIYQYLRDQGLSPKLFNIEKLNGENEAEKLLALKKLLLDCEFPAKSPSGKVLARSAKSLCELISDLRTKKHSQRPLRWNKPSPTIVSLPEDFVHPSEPRTMTVREMARFQTFPDSFEFRSKETTGSLRRRFEVPQYTQVGNAVPPVLGKAVGAVLIKILHNEAFNKEPKLAVAI